MLATRMWLLWGIYNWIYIFSFISVSHSLSLERKLHLSLVQQSEHSYVPYSWTNELKQYAISYFNWLLWKSVASNVRLTFGFPQLEMICRMGFTTTVWCWQHRDCMYKAAGSVLQSCAPISHHCSFTCHILLTLTPIHQKGMQVEWHCAQPVTLLLKHHCYFCCHLLAEFVHPGPRCSPWGHSRSTRTLLCQGCGWCAYSELRAVHPVHASHGQGYCHYCSFTESSPSGMAGSSQLHRKGASLSLPTHWCVCGIATKCGNQNLAR